MNPENPSASRETDDWCRQRLVERLQDEGADDLAKKLGACGTELALICTGCGARRMGRQQCRARWCPSCQRSIAAARLARFAGAARRMRWPLSIMLSHQNELEAENAFRTLMPAFKRFRRTKLWKTCVKGGVVSYEVTNRFGSWHDHLHALIDCEWFALEAPRWRKNMTRSQQRKCLRAAKEEVTEAWQKCVAQETAITWVDRANAGRLVEHIKYTVKGSDLLAAEGHIAPLIRALKGRRLVQPFGNCYDLGAEWKLADEADKRPCTCEHCGASDTIMPAAVFDAHNAMTSAGKSSRIIGKRTK